MPGGGDSDQVWGGGAQLVPGKSLGAITPGGELPSGTVLGRYRIVDIIGRGGMGIVYRAEHADLGMLRALKTLSPEWANHPLAQARFLKEAKAAARISHPHVVRIFDCGTHDGLPFFVMEHLEGEDLASALRRTRLTVEQTAGIMLAVCAAISEMHREGLIHRDLKPGNIFLARDKLGNIVPTLLDFGIVKPIDPGPATIASGTQDGTIVGTAHYVSPEQLADFPAGERSDQYALGVVLYQCVAGRRPFEGESAVDVFRDINRYQFPPPSALVADLPNGFEKVILTAMSKHPDERFPSVYHLGKALFPFASARHQALWVDFYGRERPPRAALSAPIPVAASSAWLPRPERPSRTAPLPDGMPQASRLNANAETLPISRGGDTRALPSMNGDVWATAIGETQVLPSRVESGEGSSGGGPKDGASRAIGDQLEPSIRGRAKRHKIASGSGRVLWRATLVGGVVAVAIIAVLALRGLGTSHGDGDKPPVERSVPPAPVPVRSAARVTAPAPTTDGVPAVAETAPVLVDEADGSRDGRPVATSRSKRKSVRTRRQETGDSGGPLGRPGRPIGKQTMESSPSTYPAVGRASDSIYPAME